MLTSGFADLNCLVGKERTAKAVKVLSRSWWEIFREWPSTRNGRNSVLDKPPRDIEVISACN
jgi:hypothetical protein